MCAGFAFKKSLHAVVGIPIFQLDKLNPISKILSGQQRGGSRGLSKEHYNIQSISRLV
jgi:hypothetical protein